MDCIQNAVLCMSMLIANEKFRSKFAIWLLERFSGLCLNMLRARVELKYTKAYT